MIDTPSARSSGDGAVWRRDSQRQGLEEKGAIVGLARASAKKLGCVGERGADGRGIRGAAEVRRARVPVRRCAVAKENGRAVRPGVYAPPAGSVPKEAMNVARGRAIAEIDRCRRNGAYPLYFIAYSNQGGSQSSSRKPGMFRKSAVFCVTSVRL